MAAFSNMGDDRVGYSTGVWLAACIVLDSIAMLCDQSKKDWQRPERSGGVWGQASGEG